MNAAIQKKYDARPQHWLWDLLILAIVFGGTIYSFVGSNINWYRLANLRYTFWPMVRQMFDIDWVFFFGTHGFAFSESVVYLTLQTLAIGFLGTLIGAIVALPFGLLAAENIVGKKWAKISEILLIMIRVLPEIILAIILVKGFGMTPLAGVLTIGLHSIGMIGKLYAEAIDNMDNSALEALDAVGAGPWIKIRYGVLPNILPDLSSIALYRFDINVRSATILGLIGAGGLGTPLMIAAINWSWSMLGTIMVAIILLVLIVDFTSSYLRKKLV